MFGGLDDEYGDGEEMTQIQATQLQESSDEEDGDPHGLDFNNKCSPIHY